MPFKHARAVHKKRRVANLVTKKLRKEEISYKSRRFGTAVEITLVKSGTELKIRSKAETQKVEVAITKRRKSQNNQEHSKHRPAPSVYSKPSAATLHVLYNLGLTTKHKNRDFIEKHRNT